MIRSTLLIAAAVGAAITIATPGVAHAGDTPGTYVDWVFDGVSGLRDVAYTITVERDPGDQSQVYWSNQVGWTNGRGGYAGYQTNASATQRMFLFSVWDVTEARPGSTGSWCQTFGGEGEGMSCRMWHKWTPGQPYRFHYQSEGAGWWGMTITNTTTGHSFKLGSIRVGADTMSPRSISWVEYYRWSDPRSSCATEPYSRARFSAPIGDDGTRRARISGTHLTSTCRDHATVTVSGDSAVHANATRNSVMGPITGIGGKCVDVANADNGTAATMWSCHGGGNQAWVLAFDGTVRSKLFTCLDANGTTDGASVTQWSCNGGANQHWRTEGNRIVNQASGKCLHAANSGDGARLTVRGCDGSTNQNWHTPPGP